MFICHYTWCKLNKKPGLILECDIVGFSLYSIISIDLSVPYYFVSLENMIIDFFNKKDIE